MCPLVLLHVATSLYDIINYHRLIERLYIHLTCTSVFTTPHPGTYTGWHTGWTTRQAVHWAHPCIFHLTHRSTCRQGTHRLARLNQQAMHHHICLDQYHLLYIADTVHMIVHLDAVLTTEHQHNSLHLSVHDVQDTKSPSASESFLVHMHDGSHYMMHSSCTCCTKICTYVLNSYGTCTHYMPV